jgi:hypothetical protein
MVFCQGGEANAIDAEGLMLQAEERLWC